MKINIEIEINDKIQELPDGMIMNPDEIISGIRDSVKNQLNNAEFYEDIIYHTGLYNCEDYEDLEDKIGLQFYIDDTLINISHLRKLLNKRESLKKELDEINKELKSI